MEKIAIDKHDAHCCLSFFMLVLLSLLFAPICPGHAGADPLLVEEKRSCIQSVDGYAYLAEKLTLADMRNAAIANAKEQALSNAKTYIRSKTEVENFTLRSDLVQMQAEGSVVVLELQDLGIEENSRYHVRLKAEVFYEMEPPPPQLATKPSAGDGPLTVRVWASKQSYRAGEKISIQLQGNRDFFARIVNIGPDGNIIQLLPNVHRSSAYLRGGVVYTIPDQGDQFDLTVSPPFGKEAIVVYASLVELGPVVMRGVEGGLSVISGDQAEMSRATRAIVVTPANNHGVKTHVTDFYEARMAFDTEQ